VAERPGGGDELRVCRPCRPQRGRGVVTWVLASTMLSTTQRPERTRSSESGWVWTGLEARLGVGTRDWGSPCTTLEQNATESFPNAGEFEAGAQHAE
jgi:hypothetical protein